MMAEQQGILLENTFLLNQVVDKYMIRKMISNKKYYAAYLTIAGDVWRELFKKTIFSTQSQWQTVKRCSGDDVGNEKHPDKLYYIDVPRETNRIFSVCEEDECGNQVPLFYNSEMNVIVKPKKKKCKCLDETCDCDGGICEDANALSKTTKLIFTINNVNYYEITYTKVCPNGDIVLYKEIPTKKYDNYSGDGGDYNNDYNNDYSTGNIPFTNFEIVTEKTQKVLCKLDVRECGCPKNTEENRKKFESACCGYMNCCSSWKKRHCETAIGDVNDNGRGHVKLSDCGTKLFYKPSRYFRSKCDGNGRIKIPHFLLLNYQTTGQSCSSSVFVPEYALEAMMSGIYYFAMKFSGAYSVSDKQMAKWDFVAQQNEVIGFLNPLSLVQLSDTQDNLILF